MNRALAEELATREEEARKRDPRSTAGLKVNWLNGPAPAVSEGCVTAWTVKFPRTLPIKRKQISELEKRWTEVQAEIETLSLLD